jgi:hypothetical protein
MSRPLLISDCDEVLLHMVAHFGEWLGEAHAIDFSPEGGDFANSMKRRSDGSILAPEEMWALLDGFFATEMHRQTLVPHAAEALAEIAEVADIVILTNLGDHCHAARVSQLDALGIRHRVVCNQGGKGAPVAALRAEYQPSAAIFVDDLWVHHRSVAKHAPSVWRLHMVSEPSLAPSIASCDAAHARIDDWQEAKNWILARFTEGPARLDPDAAPVLTGAP